jgi:hypothetical protein
MVQGRLVLDNGFYWYSRYKRNGVVSRLAYVLLTAVPLGCDPAGTHVVRPVQSAHVAASQ